MVDEQLYAPLIEQLKKLSKHFGLKMNYYTYFDANNELVVRFQLPQQIKENDDDGRET